MSNRKLSLALTNIDFNAYRAYKNIHTDRNSNNFIQHYKQNALNKPIGSHSKRYRWNEVKNIAEFFELKGTLIQRKTEQRNKSACLWDSLINKTEGNESQFSHRKMIRCPSFNNNRRNDSESVGRLLDSPYNTINV